MDKKNNKVRYKYNIEKISSMKVVQYNFGVKYNVVTF